LRLWGLLGNKRPLHPGREAGAAAPAQPRVLDLIDDRVWLHRERLLHSLVAVELKIAIEVRRALAEAAGDDLYFVGMRDEVCHLYLGNFVICILVSLSMIQAFQLQMTRLPNYKFALLLQSLKNLIQHFYRQVLMKIVVHLHGWSPAAGADALHFLQGEHSVGSRALVLDAELLATVREEFFSAAEHTGNVRADLYVVFSARLGGQHRVVAD